MRLWIELFQNSFLFALTGDSCYGSFHSIYCGIGAFRQGEDLLNLTRFIVANRPAVILATLVALSLASLATGTDPTFIQVGVKRLVGLTTYPFLKVRYSLESGVDYVIGVTFNYAALQAENHQLGEDVMTLKEELVRREEITAENERLRKLLAFVRENPKVEYAPARVIESLKGMLTIDRGRMHGIRAGMGVVTPEGVVGVVTEVLDVTSNVATLHHQDCRIAAMVQRSRFRAYDGIIHASAVFGRICTLDYIDMGARPDEVGIGDVVVTSPESLFPSGSRIGRIRLTGEKAGLLKWAEVEPFVNPYQLDEVLVVVQFLASAEELAGPIEAAPAAEEEAVAVPPVTSIQERYAP